MRYDGRISRMHEHEHEHEHELSTSVFGFKDLPAILAAGPTEAASEHLCSVLHLGQLSLYARGNWLFSRSGAEGCPSRRGRGVGRARRFIDLSVALLRLSWTQRPRRWSRRQRPRCDCARPDKPAMAGRNFGRLHPLGHSERRPVHRRKSGHGAEPGFIGRTNPVIGAVHSWSWQAITAPGTSCQATIVKSLRDRAFTLKNVQTPTGVASNAPPKYSLCLVTRRPISNVPETNTSQHERDNL